MHLRKEKRKSKLNLLSLLNQVGKKNQIYDLILLRLHDCKLKKESKREARLL